MSVIRCWQQCNTLRLLLNVSVPEYSTNSDLVVSLLLRDRIRVYPIVKVTELIFDNIV